MLRFADEYLTRVANSDLPAVDGPASDRAAGGVDTAELVETGASEPGREVRRLSGQHGDAAGQAARPPAARRGRRDRRRSSTSPSFASRPKSRARALSICTLHDDWLAARLREAVDDPRLGIRAGRRSRAP